MGEDHDLHGGDTSLRTSPDRGPTSPQPADETQAALLRHLADEVRAAGTAELAKWGIRDHTALPVRWHAADDELADHWTAIQRDQLPAALDGEFPDIRRTYEAIDSRRLVILGRAGAGKTVLAHRLALDLFTDGSGPVPVLFTLGDWNPAADLRHWMAEHLARDHPFLDAADPTTGRKQADVLIGRGSVLPVLDGFDEIPREHQAEAVRRISNLDQPLVVTSRPEQYAAAAREIRPVSSAAAIELADLRLSEAHEHLRRSTAKTRAHAWDPVFEQLRGDTAGQPLADVLTSPLTVALARTTYNDERERDPGELLDTARFPDTEALENHLLETYLDTACGRDRQHRRWLGSLARHLQRRGSHDLTWWHLPTTLHRTTRVLVTTVTAGALFAVLQAAALLLVQGTGWTFALGPRFWIGSGLAGLGYGFVVALVSEAGAGREPERLRLALPWRGRSPWANPAKYAAELVLGLALGLGLGIVVGLRSGVSDPAELVQWLAYWAALGLTFGAVNVVVSLLGDAHQPHATDQWALLARDRAFTLVRAVVTAVFAGWLVERVVSAWSAGAAPGLAHALTLGLVVGIARLALSAWGNWLLFARLWLPLTGRLPWRPKRFLEDAYERGVLRCSGAVYQFRHARLRDHLAAR